MKPHIRWLIRHDMEEVLAIELEAFGELGWNEQDFLSMLRQRITIGMVVDIEDHVRGYMIYDLAKAELVVHNFVVQKCCQREGIGSAMVDKLKSKLSSHRRTGITMSVPETNLDALLFFRSQGFLATGILRDDYEGPCGPEDGIAMAYCLPELVEAP